ncbi:MAG: hypothetical protein D6760_10270 [Deltaproteobacteria bacterium]|nr:MAG: hypothetical protein D6760_10270 [Deltaproteobacteria bacterium]
MITLLTDFGSADGYAGAVKGVLVSICPGVQIVELTHDVPPGDTAAGAFALANAVATFPPGTIHLAVVDPGVGTERRAVAVEAGGAVFVGPDNGLLWLAARAPRRVYELDRSEWFRSTVSPTFHGRDVFAPVAAHLASGVPIERLGTPAGDLSPLALPGVERSAGSVTGTVVHVDRFGNLITNIAQADLPADPSEVRVEIAGRAIEGLAVSYGHVAAGEALALVGSAGTLEIAVNSGSAAATFGVARGARVVVCTGRPDGRRSGTASKDTQ